MNKERICEILEESEKRLVFAYSSVIIIKTILDNKNDLRKSDSNFWLIILDNCAYRALIELAKLYDEQHDSVGLKKIINMVDQTKLLSFDNKNELIKKSWQIYNKVKPYREKLVKLRDKGLAHADKDYIIRLKELTGCYKLSLENIMELIHIADEICNDFLVALTGKSYNIERYLGEDTTYVIKDLKLASKVYASSFFGYF